MQTHKKVLTNSANGNNIMLKIRKCGKGVSKLYENLKIEMQRAGISIEQIAEDLDIHRNTASNKINGETDFTIQEAIFIRNYRFPQFAFEYLFKRTKSTVNENGE